eukprot:COSAG02_NODE_567_length_20212_cov_18.927460_2_plen_81_part_00
MATHLLSGPLNDCSATCTGSIDTCSCSIVSAGGASSAPPSQLTLVRTCRQTPTNADALSCCYRTPQNECGAVVWPLGVLH